MLYWEQLAWLNGAKSENSEMVLQYIWPGCIRIPACCFTAKENDDYEKKKYEGNQTAGKKGIAGTCWNCDPWASGSVWSEYFRNNLFSGTSALDLVLSEVFMLVVSLIVGIISAGLGYMLLNISRGKEFSLGDLGYFFKNQPDRVIVAGFVLAMIQLITAIPYYYVSFTTDPGLTVDSQIQWLSMTLGLLAVSTLLNFLISLPFAMTYFLMADDTELGGIQALKESARLMKGNIWRYVKLNLSFIPLLLLSVFTFYIALFWIMPYMEMSMVAFYRDLDGELDYRLPGDGTADGGFHNWTNDSGNGYDTENNDGYRN